MYKQTMSGRRMMSGHIRWVKSLLLMVPVTEKVVLAMMLIFSSLSVRCWPTLILYSVVEVKMLKSSAAVRRTV